jgi:hypothetical protein
VVALAHGVDVFRWERVTRSCRGWSPCLRRKLSPSLSTSQKTIESIAAMSRLTGLRRSVRSARPRTCHVATTDGGRPLGWSGPDLHPLAAAIPNGPGPVVIIFVRWFRRPSTAETSLACTAPTGAADGQRNVSCPRRQPPPAQGFSAPSPLDTLPAWRPVAFAGGASSQSTSKRLSTSRAGWWRSD